MVESILRDRYLAEAGIRFIRELESRKRRILVRIALFACVSSALGWLLVVALPRPTSAPLYLLPPFLVLVLLALVAFHNVSREFLSAREDALKEDSTLLAAGQVFWSLATTVLFTMIPLAAVWVAAFQHVIDPSAAQTSWTYAHLLLWHLAKVAPIVSIPDVMGWDKPVAEWHWVTGLVLLLAQLGLLTVSARYIVAGWRWWTGESSGTTGPPTRGGVVLQIAGDGEEVLRALVNFIPNKVTGPGDDSSSSKTDEIPPSGGAGGCG